MTVEVFIDADVLVRAVDRAPAAASKRETARAIIRQDRFGTSAQVIQAFYVAATRKLATPLSPVIAARWVDRLARMPFVATDAVLVKTAIIRASAWKLSYWDACTLSAAEALGARVLLTEGLAHGQVYGHVRIVDPFIEPAFVATT